MTTIPLTIRVPLLLYRTGDLDANVEEDGGSPEDPRRHQELPETTTCSGV
jgi:hypothetical protein